MQRKHESTYGSLPRPSEKEMKEEEEGVSRSHFGTAAAIVSPSGKNWTNGGLLWHHNIESPRKRREKDEMDLKVRLLLLALFCHLAKLLFSYKKKYVSLFVFGLLGYCHFPLKI